MTNGYLAASGVAAQRPKVSFERERGVYAVHITRDVAHVVARVEAGDERSAEILNLFRALAEAQVPIFLIKFHRSAVTFALAGDEVARAEQALTNAAFKHSTRRDLALITILAASMQDVSSIMVAVGDALHLEGATLFGTGDSHDSVQCLTEAEHASAVVEQLCAAFGLSASAIYESLLESGERA